MKNSAAAARRTAQEIGWRLPHRWRAWLLGLVLMVATLCSVDQAQAADVRRSFDMVPSKTVLELSPGEVWRGEIKVATDSPETGYFYVTARDFNASADENGTPRFLVDEQDTSVRGLSKWITYDDTPLLLETNLYKTIPVTITIPRNANPGGHYGALLLSSTPLDNRGDFGGSSVAAAIASLFILNVRGDTTDRLTIADFVSSQDVYWAFPTDLTLRLSNEGESHIRPSGMIEIINEFSQVVDTISIEEEGYVLPGSIRRFGYSWGMSKPLLPGILPDWVQLPDPLAVGVYRARVTLWYGEDARQTVSAQTMLVVLPWLPLAFLSLLALAGSLLIKLLLTRYEQRVLRQFMRRKRGQH